MRGERGATANAVRTCSEAEAVTRATIPAMSGPPQFASYEEFFAFYVKQHRDPRNRLMHACGTALGLTVLVVAFVTGHPWLALLWIPVAYGFAWTGHFLIEKNTPATFGHPLWSFISDFRMLALMLTGGLSRYLK
jgi:hypothetical protein